MRAELTRDTDRLQFHCVGGAAGSSEYARHAHRATITVVDANHIRTDWYTYERGRKQETETFHMIRVTD